MGNRRKSWRRALIEGLQTLTFFSGMAIIAVYIYNLLHHYVVMELYYLLIPIFIFGSIVTYKHTLQQIKRIIKVTKYKQKFNAK